MNIATTSDGAGTTVRLTGRLDGEAALQHNLTATIDPESLCIIGGTGFLGKVFWSLLLVVVEGLADDPAGQRGGHGLRPHPFCPGQLTGRGGAVLDETDQHRRLRRCQVLIGRHFQQTPSQPAEHHPEIARCRDR